MLRLLAVSVLALLFALPAAATPVDDGFAALQAGDFAKAREAFADPTLAVDPVAHTALARLHYFGKGGPRDLVAGYAHLTLAVMYSPLAKVPGLLAERRAVDAMMGLDEIAAAEAQVVAMVDATIGADERRTRVAAAIDDLGSDDPERRKAARLAVLGLGPAAADAAPAIEKALKAEPTLAARTTYAFGLVYLGSEGVKALARIVRDRPTIDSDGLWNADQAASALTEVGQLTHIVLGDLVAALTDRYPDAPIAEATAPPGAGGVSSVRGFKVKVARAILSARDPDKAAYAALHTYVAGESDPAAKAIAARVIAGLYGEPDLAVEAAAAAMRESDAEVQLAGLGVAGELKSAALPLVTQVRGFLGGAGDKRVSERARATLNAIFNEALVDATKAEMAGDFAKATAAAGTVLASDPTNPIGLFILAFIDLAEGRTAEARDGAMAALRAADDAMAASLGQLLAEGGALEVKPPGQRDQALLEAGLGKCFDSDACAAVFRSGFERRIVR